MSTRTHAVELERLLEHREWVRRVAQSLVRDEHMAADIEQDLWVEMLARPPRLRGSLRGWLATALRNILLNRRRGDERRRRREQLAHQARPDAPPEQVLAAAESHQLVVNAVMGLSEPYRTAILLRFFENLPPARISAHLGIPVETVRTRVRRACALIKQRLEGEFGSDRQAWCVPLLPLLGGPRLTHSVPVAGATHGAILGGIVMSKKVGAVAAAALVVGAGLATLISSGPSGDEAQTEAANARPDDVRAVVSPEQERSTALLSDRIGRLESSTGGNTQAIEHLQATVSRLEAAIAKGELASPSELDPEARTVEVLERLKAIKQGERVIAISAAMNDLVEIGDPAVPRIAEVLESDYDQDWGGGFSTGGNAVKSYGRLRMVLIDALRQIGTPAAKKQLLDAVEKSRGFADYRDLLLMYASTTDPDMVKGISTLVPGLLRRIAEVGVPAAEKDASMLMRLVVNWIRAHDMAETSGAVEEILAGMSPGPSFGAFGGLLGVLVEYAPERAFALARKQLEAHRGGAAPLLRFMQFGTNGPSLAKLARYCELLFTLDIAASNSSGIYTMIRSQLSRRTGDPKERAANGRVLLRFLESRVEADTGAGKASLERTIAALRKQIEEAEGK